jgi:pyruvate/2-oxoglutarate dehydrogenase complex dihydrolipoamide dehydrogenase (E3) component
VVTLFKRKWPLPERRLGASLLGIECDEVIHSTLDVMYANAPYTMIQRAMHIHPAQQICFSQLL